MTSRDVLRPSPLRKAHEWRAFRTAFNPFYVLRKAPSPCDPQKGGGCDCDPLCLCDKQPTFGIVRAHRRDVGDVSSRRQAAWLVMTAITLGNVRFAYSACFQNGGHELFSVPCGRVKVRRHKNHILTTSRGEKGRKSPRARSDLFPCCTPAVVILISEHHVPNQLPSICIDYFVVRAPTRTSSGAPDSKPLWFTNRRDSRREPKKKG